MALALIVGLLVGQPDAAIPWPSVGSEAVVVADGRLHVTLKAAQRATLISVRDPKLPDSRFVFKTDVESIVISGRAVLEMHVTDTNGDRFTVRTKDTGGPMSPLAANGWRSVELPFVSDPNHPPKEIVVDIVSEGEGEWRFQPFRIERWQRSSLTWLAAGGYAAALGVAFGLVFGVYGLLAAVPSSRRAAYRFGIIGAALGLLFVCTAPVLHETSYPFGIWLPTLVAGIVAFCLFGGTLPMVKKGIESADRMRASADPSLEPA